jgi:hypothetical protein
MIKINPKSEYLNPKQYQMFKIKQYSKLFGTFDLRILRSVSW